MKPLSTYCESLLDADFDISEQDIILDALKGLFKFFLTHDQTKSAAELERIMTSHNCPEASPMRNSKNSKDNIVVCREMEHGIASIYFMTRLNGGQFGSQIRFDWLGAARGGSYCALGRNNIASISNHRHSPTYKCWLIPQHFFDDLFEYAKSLR